MGGFSVSVWSLSVSLCLSLSLCLFVSVCLSVSVFFCLSVSPGDSQVPAPLSPSAPAPLSTPVPAFSSPFFSWQLGPACPMPLSLTLHPLTSQCPFTQGLHSLLCWISNSWREKKPGGLEPAVLLTRLGSGHVEPCLRGQGGFCKKAVQSEEVMSSKVQPRPSSASHLPLLPMDLVLGITSSYTFPLSSSPAYWFCLKLSALDLTAPVVITGISLSIVCLPN